MSPTRRRTNKNVSTFSQSFTLNALREGRNSFWYNNWYEDKDKRNVGARIEF